MILRYPLLLLLLLLVPLLVWLRYRSRSKANLRFSDRRMVRGVPPGWGVRLQPLLPSLYAAALILLVIALARPQRTLHESRSHTEGIDIVLTIDVSGSMLAIDFSEQGRQINRLEAVVEVARDFVNRRPSDRIALIAFAGIPFTYSPLTLDHGFVLQQIDRLEAGTLADGTAIGDALISSLNRLTDSEAASRVVILLTDGVNNTGVVSPEQAGAAAEALGIRVHTVAAGAEGMVLFPVRSPFGGIRYTEVPSEIDEPSLIAIAERTGGKFFRASDLRGLRRIYDELDRLERSEIEMEHFVHFEERFPPFAWAALLFLALEKILSAWRWGRLP